MELNRLDPACHAGRLRSYRGEHWASKPCSPETQPSGGRGDAACTKGSFGPRPRSLWPPCRADWRRPAINTCHRHINSDNLITGHDLSRQSVVQSPPPPAAVAHRWTFLPQPGLVIAAATVTVTSIRIHLPVVSSSAILRKGSTSPSILPVLPSIPTHQQTLDALSSAKPLSCAVTYKRSRRFKSYGQDCIFTVCVKFTVCFKVTVCVKLLYVYRMCQCLDVAHIKS